MSPIEVATGVLRCNGCDEEVIDTLGQMIRHDRECKWHDANGDCRHSADCYSPHDDAKETAA